MHVLRSAAIDTGLLSATATLGEILSVVAHKDPHRMATALSREVALVVFPKDGTPIPFRIRFFAPGRVVVVPGHLHKPRTRIACTRQALRRWVRGDLDVREAMTRRWFIVAGDAAPLKAIAGMLGGTRAPVLYPKVTPVEPNEATA